MVVRSASPCEPSSSLGCCTDQSVRCDDEEGRRQYPANFLPSKNADYLRLDYWDKRFAEEKEYEWFKGYSDFRHLVQEHVSVFDRILVIGCGNSHMSEDMCRDGYKFIASTDLSPIVVDRMRQRATSNGCHVIKWMVADMMALPFPESSFDIVIEKGVMDVLFVDDRSVWDPSDEVKTRVRNTLNEIHRVLSPRGAFISIAFGQPHFRRTLFESSLYSWQMLHRTFGDCFHYYFYVLRKGTKRQNLSIDGEGEQEQRQEEEEEESLGDGRTSWSGRERDGGHTLDMHQEQMDGEDYLLRAGLSDTEEDSG